jgi:hypothetical protein
MERVRPDEPPLPPDLPGVAGEAAAKSLAHGGAAEDHQLAGEDPGAGRETDARGAPET